ncbi:MAG: HAD-IC family P-type ATPase [Catenulisporales bacterium]|nr:HAD-IC family P-type ATPase [Catenulisporales bacterium]
MISWNDMTRLPATGLRMAATAVGAVTGAGPQQRERRVWSRQGRAHVEVKGLTGHGERHRRLAEEVSAALRTLKGVHWAEVNAATRHVLVDFDEGDVDVGRLVAIVEDVEREHGAGEEEFLRDKPAHPSAQAPVTEAATALAADALGLAVALTGRVLRVPAAPAVLRVPVLVAENTPKVRGLLEDRLGAGRVELLLGLSNAGLNALAQGPGPLLVDGSRHLLAYVEARARLAVWHRREPDLVGDGGGLPLEVSPRVPRPAPYPDGPIEALGDRAALASLTGALGTLVMTGDPGRAGDLLLATVPKAARAGREAFAATLAWELTRRGVVPMDATVLRRLDRISTLVVDSDALCSARSRVLSVETLDPRYHEAEIWEAAAGFAAEPGPRASVRDIYQHGDPSHLVGRARIGREPDPLADALLTAARSAGVRVVLTEHDSVADLTAWADEVLPAGADLADEVRRLQAGGAGVLLVSRGHDAALHAADVGIAAVHRSPVPWSADLICGPGLGEVWRVLNAVRVGREVSERSARLALGGASLGALIALTGPRRRGRAGLLAPVNGAAFTAVAAGAVSALRVGRLDLPESVARADWHALTPQEAWRRVRESRESVAESSETVEPLAFWDGAVETVHRAAAGVAAVPGVAALAAPTRYAGTLASATARELRDPLTPVLALGAAASAVVGSAFDAGLVGGVMAGNALVGGFQRLHAESALRGLLLGEQVTARRVVRPPELGGGADSAADSRESAPAGSATEKTSAEALPPDTDSAGSAAGTDSATDTLENALAEFATEKTPADTLRPGNVVLVRAGDIVPADLRLLTAEDLELDESSLTGESVPVAKAVPATPGAELDARSCMLYEGSTVLGGHGFGLVVAVGRATEAGRAARIAGNAAPAPGIGARLAELSRITLPAAGIGGLAVTGLSALRGVPWRQAAASGVATAIAAIPEGLPLVATVAQLAGARRLSRRGILVRSSRSLEALGRVDTVCFDKTGTLTRGRLNVAVLADLDGELALDDSGGRRLLRVAARACPHEGIRAHATDRVVAEAAAETVGTDSHWHPVSELPFETTRGYAACLGTNDTHAFLAVKGAPETVLAACSRIRQHAGKSRSLPVDAAVRREALAAVGRLAGRGLRVLAVAQRRPDVEPRPGIEVAPLVDDLELLGFVGLSDTPRDSAAEAVQRLGELGVRVTVITGDHPVTATAIAEEVGVPDADRVVTGAELDRLTPDERARRVTEARVFARVSPEQKVRVVEALRRAGRVVAMTGDGANDAAAIRLADVGVALAGRGSAAARTAADLVIAEPDPARLVDALAEGRSLWDRVRDATSILVGGNAGEVAFTLAGTAVGGRAPLSTRQLLLVNMLTDMLPAMAVALSPGNGDGDGNGSGVGAGSSGLGEGADAGDRGVGGGVGAKADSPSSNPAGSLRSQEAVGSAAPSVPATSLWGPELARSITVRGGATAIGASAAWFAGRLTGRARRADTMGLAALVGTQLGQTLLAARRSPLVATTVAGSALALFAVVETPGVSRFFGCTPLGPVAWSIVIAASAAGTAVAAVPGWVDRLEPIQAWLTPVSERLATAGRPWSTMV